MTGTGPHRVTLAAWISCAPFERLLGITINHAADGSAVLSMPFSAQLAQGAGLMHGGALVSLADTAVVMAIKSIINEQTHFATIGMESRFVYPVREGVVTARAEVTRRDGRLLYGQAIVYDDKEREVMRFVSTFKISAAPRSDAAVPPREKEAVDRNPAG